jgi:hypothetical protein
MSANVDLRLNWTSVDDWEEAVRYQRNSLAEARKLFDAITEPTNGVLTWLKQHW